MKTRVLRAWISHGMITMLLHILLSGVSIADTGFLGFPLAGYGPYNAPISAVFDHSLDATPFEKKNLKRPFKKDGVVMAYTGEKGDGLSHASCFQQKNGYIFRLSGNYQGSEALGKTYLCSDGHPGINYPVPPHTHVLAAAEGRIIESRCKDGHPRYGKYIKIDHDNGYYTLYGNLGSCVRAHGDVKKGQRIGESGTASGSGDHYVHFQVRHGNEYGKRYSVDPYGREGENILWESAPTPCSDDYEPNDFFGGAHELQASGEEYKGIICSSADQDFFTLEAAGSGELSLALYTPLSRDYQLEIYNKSHLKVGRAQTAQAGEKKIKLDPLSAGIYYVRIYGEKGDHDSKSSYTLKAAWSMPDSVPSVPARGREPLADFRGYPTTGASPMTVNYSHDAKAYDLPMRFTWDFNNDGTADSDDQNPSYTYTRPGRYTVKLSVSDSEGRTETLIRTDYITVEERTEPRWEKGPDKETASVSRARRWKKAGINSAGLPVYIDSRTLSYKGKNIVTFWVKLIEDNNDNILLFEIDCKKNKFRTLEKSSESPPPGLTYSKKWKYIRPESTTEIMYDAVCRPGN